MSPIYYIPNNINKCIVMSSNSDVWASRYSKGWWYIQCFYHNKKTRWKHWRDHVDCSSHVLWQISIYLISYNRIWSDEYIYKGMWSTPWSMSSKLWSNSQEDVSDKYSINVFGTYSCLTRTHSLNTSWHFLWQCWCRYLCVRFRFVLENRREMFLGTTCIVIW